jgi:hypothetical protein
MLGESAGYLVFLGQLKAEMALQWYMQMTKVALSDCA